MTKTRSILKEQKNTKDEKNDKKINFFFLQKLLHIVAASIDYRNDKKLEKNEEEKDYILKIRLDCSVLQKNYTKITLFH